MKINFTRIKYKLRDRQFISSFVLVVLLVILTVAGVMLLRDYDMEGMVATLTPRAQDTSVGVGDRQTDDEAGLVWEETEGEPEETEEAEEVDDVPAPVRVVDQDIYREQAKTGEGLTHLARRALDSYLRDSGQSISNAQRIYAEDYIQLRVPIGGMRWLEVGQEVEISKSLIEEAVERAGQLTPVELDNLDYYASLVF